MLLDAVVFNNDWTPTAVLHDAVVLQKSELIPIATLETPVVLEQSDA